MNVEVLRPGHRVATTDAREAEVLELVPEGAVRIAYLDESGGPFGSPRCTEEEEVVVGDKVAALLGAVAPATWRNEIAVVLHYVAESGDGPGEYRAETLSGVPNDVVVSGGSSISAEEALNHLLGGLYLMGFGGTAVVNDATGVDSDRYEVEVPGGS